MCCRSHDYFRTIGALSKLGDENGTAGGGSPGLVVMGGDSHSKGCGFESRCRILDGNDVFHIDLFKNCIVCLKRPKINEKEAWVGPFFRKWNCSKQRLLLY